MQPESTNEAVRSGEAGAFIRPQLPANDPLDCPQDQQRWLRFEAARYIEQLLAEMGVMARAAELQHLFYFLDMARQEASTQAQRWRDR
ncbi:hypothetical protein [Bosea sp. BK604]|uniref:hypothetical protein n=1 Tax=Bosea sp. BK604 TaxID=2512180 RepID=UPI001046ED25|nr:hypothetical protein [Bosea sp. BK604]TCR66237.1 hypothetical protein EV560_104115 [Bosea sp. BK604]